MYVAVLVSALFCLYISGIRTDSLRALSSADRPVYRVGCDRSNVTCPVQPKTVTLHVLNVFKPPYMDMSICLHYTCQKYLLGVMEEAADRNKSFRFSATYFNFELGFYVDAYNNVYANFTLDESYWLILNSSMLPIPLGVSNYIPTDGEIVTFNLTTGGH